MSAAAAASSVDAAPATSTASTPSPSSSFAGGGSSSAPSTSDSTVWNVTSTWFVDDYKPRGDWSDSQVRTFSTEALARSFVQRAKLQWLHEQLQWGEEIKGEQRHLWRKNKAGHWRLRDPSKIDKVIEPYIEGEFVWHRMLWEVAESIVETKEEKAAVEEEWPEEEEPEMETQAAED